MKRPIPTARTVTNAFGISEVYQEDLLNMFAEAPAPIAREEFTNDLTYALRTVSGERRLIDPDLLRGRVLGCIWMEHHNIPHFSNKLLVCTTAGVEMFKPEGRTPRTFVRVPDSYKAWPGGPVQSEVHIVSNGFSWVIGAGERAFVYHPKPLRPREDPQDNWPPELRKFVTVREYKDSNPTPSIPDSVVGADGALTAATLDEWWRGYRSGGRYDWPEAIAEFDAGSPGFGSVIFHGGRYIAHERGSGRFYWSGVAGSFDQHTFLPLDYATAASDGDPMVGLVSNRKIFYPLGTRTAEVWYSNVPGRVEVGQVQTGGGASVDLPYAHAPASDSDRGCVGEFASAHIAGTAFWLGRDGSVFAAAGRDVERATGTSQSNILAISTEGGAAEARDLTGSRLFGWQQFGHDFLAVRVEGAPTLVFDLTTGTWHRRGDGRGPWRIRGVVEGGTRGRLIGWASDGIYELVTGYDKFDGIGNIPRSVTLPIIENNREDITPRELEVLTQLSGGRPAEEMTLHVSRDRGVTVASGDIFTAYISGTEPSVFRGFAGSSPDFTFTLSYGGSGVLTIFGVYFDYAHNDDFAASVKAR